MKIDTEIRDGKTLLHCHEERLDAHNSTELKDTLLRQLEAGPPMLILNLAEVRFIDSSGLGALLSGFKNANLRQGKLVLVGLQPRVQAMFELTRLHRVFRTYPTLAAALLSAQEEEPSHDEKSGN
ncbi:STAS domain-containing protein [Methylococcus sp. EFPC2]|uniref:STAS domain-containing protein n=1 Tax=Methylococcus sp. EFPC2 TaxID=2812648 RepID=UPI0019689C14|nr:STAS domain-containing protein [Methylococcus sp. EFPC2]QSA95731.1 STAS domain-containing protein [Methylococcus sp. EFPC2]